MERIRWIIVALVSAAWLAHGLIAPFAERSSLETSWVEEQVLAAPAPPFPTNPALERIITRR